jgi:hypothetical protein
MLQTRSPTKQIEHLLALSDRYNLTLLTHRVHAVSESMPETEAFDLRRVHVLHFHLDSLKHSVGMKWRMIAHQVPLAWSWSRLMNNLDHLRSNEELFGGMYPSLKLEWVTLDLLAGFRPDHPASVVAGNGAGEALLSLLALNPDLLVRKYTGHPVGFWLPGLWMPARSGDAEANYVPWVKCVPYASGDYQLVLGAAPEGSSNRTFSMPVRV